MVRLVTRTAHPGAPGEVGHHHAGERADREGVGAGPAALDEIRPLKPRRHDAHEHEQFENREQRDDDNEEVIANRLKVYNAQTAPLIEHYQGREMLKIVNADQPVDRVYTEFVKVTGA